LPLGRVARRCYRRNIADCVIGAMTLDSTFNVLYRGNLDWNPIKISRRENRYCLYIVHQLENEKPDLKNQY